MSVEISGPQGYEYQYLITAYIAVSAYVRWGADCQLIVEPLNGEDAELNCEIGKVYIQAKQFSGTLNAEKMIAWIKHAPRGSLSLWQRVAEDDEKGAIIITSARCEDAVSSFRGRMDLSSYEHDTSPLSPQVSSDILSEICEEYGVTKTSAKETAKRIVVWEQISLELLIDRIREEVVRVGIARSQVNQVITELLEAVRSARDQRSDCFANVVRTLISWRDADLVLEPATIVDREDIELLESVLLQERLLLLRGRSQCGKSITARMLLARMRTQGFKVHIGQDVREATRILYATGADDIVYLLDDPIGLNETHPELAWEGLQRLVSNLPPHRYLIITSRTDDLYRLLGEEETEWDLFGSSWTDLTVTDRAFLWTIWQQMSSGLSQNVRSSIEQHITHDPIGSLLQPGQLRFLVRQRNEELATMSSSMLLSKARFNSRSLSSILSRQGPAIRNILRVLSLVSTHVESSIEEDIAYILSDGFEYPSEDKREFPYLKTYRLGTLDEEDICSPPQYQNAPTLDGVYAEALDALERQGMLQRYAGRVQFTHPDYSEAAIIARDIRSQGDQVAIENFYLKAIFSVDPTTAYTAARSLSIEQQRRHARNKPYEYIFTIALRGLRSLYPRVRDACLEILILAINKLSKSQKEEVWRVLDNYYADTELINWIGDEPWIVPSIEQPLKIPRALEPKFNPMEPTLPQVFNSSYDTWHALQNNALPYEALIKSLEKPESFIRREAVSQLMGSNRTVHHSVLDRILDDHPVVTSEAIWVLIANRPSAGLLIIHRERLVKAAGRVGVAIVLRHRFFRAAFRAYPAIKAKSEVVLEILKSILESLPLSPNFTDDVHLDGVLESLTRILPEERYIEIARIRFSYLMQRLKFSLPDDYGLCISDFILKHVPADEPDRYRILKELLNHPETAVAVSSLAYCMSWWNNMTPKERELCTEVLTTERDDSVWLKAVVLTRSQAVPSEVLNCLNLPDNFFSLSESASIRALSDGVLSACIRMYSGKPQPLWYIGLHHDGKDKWLPIIEMIASMPMHEQFIYCLDSCLHLACSGNWPNGEENWRNIIRTIDKDLRKQIVEILFKNMAMYNGAQLRGYWHQVFEICEKQEYIDLLFMISEHIDVFQYFNKKLSHVIYLLEEAVFIDLLSFFPEDNLMIQICLQVKNQKLSALEALELIMSVYGTQPHVYFAYMNL